MSAIELDDDEDQGLGVIVLAPSGSLYSNQCGGHACHHPTAEGIYVPLGDSPDEFEAHFYGPGSKWSGRCFDGIDEETARFIDAHLRSRVFGGAGCITVDRARLADSEEAWIHVVIAENADARLSAHGGRPGILTWRNSD